jgi:hypothetical protein
MFTRLCAAVVAALFTAQAFADTPCDPSTCDSDAIAARFSALLDDDVRAIVVEAQEDDSALAIAAAEWARDRVAEQAPHDAVLRRIAATRLVDALLDAGFAAEAVAAYEALPAAQREELLDAPVIDGSKTMPGDYGVKVVASAQLTAAGLAAAYVELDRRDEAPRMLVYARKTVVVEPGVESARLRESRKVGECLRVLLDADANTDWFGWRFDRNSADCLPLPTRRVYARLVSRTFDAVGFPAEWGAGIAPHPQHDGRRLRPARLDAALANKPALRQRADALRAALAHVDEANRRWPRIPLNDWMLPYAGNGSEDQPPSEASIALARTLERRLADARPDPFRVVASTARFSDAKNGDCAALRCQQIGNVQWQLETSADYDPTGEVPSAGFWLRRIENGEERRHYLGLREHRPYEFATTGAPFIIDGELRLLARRAPIVGKIMLPPVGLQFDRAKSTVELRAKLDDVLRDGDADGLGDLAERQLLLDPANPDSDGDGIRDGDDPLPNVARGGASGDRERAFAAVLARLHGTDAAISFGVPGSEAFVRRRKGDEATLFVVTDPANLAGLDAAHRIIVLPPSFDLATLQKHDAYSIFNPTHVTLTLLGNGRYAQASYGTGWSWGTYYLALRDGRWTVIEGVSVVT